MGRARERERERESERASLSPPPRPLTQAALYERSNPLSPCLTRTKLQRGTASHAFPVAVAWRTHTHTRGPPLAEPPILDQGSSSQSVERSRRVNPGNLCAYYSSPRGVDSESIPMFIHVLCLRLSLVFFFFSLSCSPDPCAIFY